MTATGLELRSAEALLISRARDYLTAGPSDVVPFIAAICQLPPPPRAVAEHMATALLSAHQEFSRVGDGRWCLTSQLPSATAIVAPVSERLAELSYVVVDVETTGGQPFAGDRITEIAAVVVQGGEIGEVYSTLVNPERSIPPMITRLTNISWDMVRDAPRFREIVPQLGAVLHGNIFVAHNASFDWKFVTAEIGRATGEQLAGRRLCTVRLARRLLPQLPRRSLDHVARYYGVEIEARHRAAGDAVATARVLIRMLREAAEHGCETWRDLEQLLEGTPTTKKRRRSRSALPRPVDRDPTF